MLSSLSHERDDQRKMDWFWLQKEMIQGKVDVEGGKKSGLVKRVSRQSGEVEIQRICISGCLCGATLLLYWEEEEEEDGCYSPSESPSSLFTLCQTSGTSPADPWCLECFHSSPPDPPSGCSGCRVAHRVGRGQPQRISCPGSQASRLVFARTAKTSSLRRLPRVKMARFGQAAFELTGALSHWLPLPASHLPSTLSLPPPPLPLLPQPPPHLPQSTFSPSHQSPHL